MTVADLVTQIEREEGGRVADPGGRWELRERRTGIAIGEEMEVTLAETVLCEGGALSRGIANVIPTLAIPAIPSYSELFRAIPLLFRTAAP